MIITLRDRDLLEALSSYGLLSTTQLAHAFFPGVRMTTILRRLRALERASLIRRVNGLPEGRLAWLSTDAGNRTVGSGYPVKRPNRNSLEHDVLLSNVRRAFEEACVFDSWTPEHALKAKRLGDRRMLERTALESVPDALLVCRRQLSERSSAFATIALELELHSKNQDRYKKTFTHYQRLSSIFAVWYLVPTLSLGRHLQEIWDATPRGYEPVPRLMWTLIDDAMSNPGSMLNQGVKPSVPVSQIFKFEPIARKLPSLTAHGGAHPVSGEGKTCEALPVVNLPTTSSALHTQT